MFFQERSLIVIVLFFFCFSFFFLNKKNKIVSNHVLGINNLGITILKNKRLWEWSFRLSLSFMVYSNTQSFCGLKLYSILCTCQSLNWKHRCAWLDRNHRWSYTSATVCTSCEIHVIPNASDFYDFAALNLTSRWHGICTDIQAFLPERFLTNSVYTCCWSHLSSLPEPPPTRLTEMYLSKKKL